MKTTYIVISDIHGNDYALEKLRPYFLSCYGIIFLGDGEKDLDILYNEFSNKLIAVSGNCDYYSNLSESLIFCEQNLTLYLTHGHKHYVKSGLTDLSLYCLQKGYDIALYGHTHVSKVEIVNGVLTVNPGTLSKYGDKQTFAVLTVNNGVAEAEIKELEE